jgi:hypothetical protein
MLAIADKHGIVIGSIPGLAKIASITIPATIEGLNKLLSPDPFSGTKDHEGRRIEQVDRGWRILNYLKFRNLRDKEERREYMRQLMADRREKAKTEKPLAKTLADVSNVSTRKQKLAHAEAEADIKPKPPYPPFSKGGLIKPLTPREHKKLMAELQRIGQASVGAEIDDRLALQTACARIGIDFDRARHLLECDA